MMNMALVVVEKSELFFGEVVGFENYFEAVIGFESRLLVDVFTLVDSLDQIK